MRKKLLLFSVLLLAGFTIFLTFNRHSKSGVFRYNSEIWADRAGYYSYLPMLFIYQYQVDRLPDSIDIKTGGGFFVDTINHKVVTKYPAGVAMMQAPFFMVTHLLASPMGYNADGFSIIYHRMIDIAAVVYLFAGLFFLYLLLISRVGEKAVLTALFFLFAGTNLFYYGIFDTGMSHIYSFALFSFFLWISSRIFSNKGSAGHFVAWGFAAGLILAVRPVNLVFFPSLLLLFSPGWGWFMKHPGKLMVSLISSFLVLVPQMLYWKYISGNWIMDTYTGEGFTHLTSPRVVEVLFSTNNGLILYNPLILIMFIGLARFGGGMATFTENRGNRWSLMFYFLLLLWLFASWYEWSYGCAYGFRPFTEYYALLALPFARLIEMEVSRKRWLLIALMVIFTLYNQKMIFTWGGCWMHDPWNWQAWVGVLTGNFK